MYKRALRSDELMHHGILGQKWGVRRFQNPDGTLTSAGKKRYLKDMHKDMEGHFKSQISKEAGKVTSLGKNGHDVRGVGWNEAYRKGKVNARDDIQIRKAAKETRKWAEEKYGKSAVDALAKSGVLGRKIGDFDVKTMDTGKKLTTEILRKVNSQFVSNKDDALSRLSKYTHPEYPKKQTSKLEEYVKKNTIY